MGTTCWEFLLLPKASDLGEGLGKGSLSPPVPALNFSANSWLKSRAYCTLPDKVSAAWKSPKSAGEKL